MRRNLALTNGLIVSEAVMMRLAAAIGRHEAHQLLYEAAQRSQSETVPFLTCITEHPLLTRRSLPVDLAQALEPARYTGQSAALTASIVRALTPRRPAAGPRE
jgi:3-carboxy-cis,cis-muconate cycloisomerase